MSNYSAYRRFEEALTGGVPLEPNPYDRNPCGPVHSEHRPILSSEVIPEEATLIARITHKLGTGELIIDRPIEERVLER